jgi:hypothetical protein
MAKKPHLLPSKKNAPRKTGKAGIKPLDEEEDFEKPVVDKKSAAAGEQPELLETPKEKKIVVVKDRFEVFILPPVFANAPKTSDKTISFRVSFALTDDHKGLFPKIVESNWNWVKRPRQSKSPFEMPGQTVAFFLASDVKEEEMRLPAAKVTHANVAVIQKKGEGAALKVTRFQFRLQVPWSREVAKFADANYNVHLWLTMKTTEEKLFDDEPED